jgi:chorismate synthase
VKAVEIGDAFEISQRRGSEAHDAIYFEETSGRYVRKTNRAGGLEGGMSNGEPIICRAVMKPLATLNRPVLATVDVATKQATVSFRERTDVTAVPAMGVVAETMVALVLAGEAMRKFGGDSIVEFRRNYDSYIASIGETLSPHVASRENTET